MTTGEGRRMDNNTLPEETRVKTLPEGKKQSEELFRKGRDGALLEISSGRVKKGRDDDATVGDVQGPRREIRIPFKGCRLPMGPWAIGSKGLADMAPS